MVKYIFRLPNDSSCNTPCQVVFTHSSPIVNERRGARTSYGWQKHWRSGRSNRRCEPPQIGPHDKGAIERLAPLTKKQYSGTWTLDKGAIERVCAAEWLRRLSEGFGQGGAQIELKIYLHAFSDSVNCQTAGNSIIQNSRLAIIGFHWSRPLRVGLNKRLEVEKQVQAWLGSCLLNPF